MIRKYLYLFLFLFFSIYSNSTLRIVHARIKGSTVMEGKEFISSVKVGSDKERSYTITFKEPFKTEPAIVVNTEGDSNCYGVGGSQKYAMPVVFATDFSSYQEEFEAAQKAILSSIATFKSSRDALSVFLKKELNKEIDITKITDDVKAYVTLVDTKAASLKKEADELIKKAQSDCSLPSQFVGDLKDFSTSVTSGDVAATITSLKSMSDLEKSVGSMGVKLAAMQLDKGADILNSVTGLVGVKIPTPSEISAQATKAVAAAQSAVSSATSAAVSSAKHAASGAYHSVTHALGF